MIMTALTTAVAWFAFGYSITDMIQKHQNAKHLNSILKEIEDLQKDNS